MQFLMDNAVWILFMAAVVFFAFGIVKRKIIPILIAISLLISMAIVQPQVIENVKTTITNIFNGGVEPMKDEDYQEVIDQLDDLGDKVKPEKKPDVFTRP